jgi:hypothetical protein
MKGFRFLGDAKPNDAHKAIRQLQQRGVIKHVITQNVDGLHSKAGTDDVLNIHGRIDEVKCMTCGIITCRHEFQSQLETYNPYFLSTPRFSDGEVTDPSSSFPPNTCQAEEGSLLDRVRADGDLDLDPSVDISQVRGVCSWLRSIADILLLDVSYFI